MLRLTYKTAVLLLLVSVPFLVFAQSGLVNINTASSVELQTLTGIGPTKAQAIIDYRFGPTGPFETIEEIKNVSGIGDATYAGIKDFITVGTQSSATPSPNPTPTPASPTPTTSAVSYGASVVSSKKSDNTTSVSAGKDRTTAVGTPLEFKAETEISYTKSTIFRWNFGDGVERDGILVNHAYEYPGEYTVVLNATLPSGLSSSRVSVKVVEPELSIDSATPERIEVKNNSKYEVSLFGRALMVGAKTFLFPQDTIVKAGQSLFFSTRVTGLTPAELTNVKILVLGNTERSKVGAVVEVEKQKQVVQIQQELGIIEETLASIYNSPEQSVVKKEEIVEAEIPVQVLAETQTATVAKSGWWASLKNFFLRSR